MGGRPTLCLRTKPFVTHFEGEQDISLLCLSKGAAKGIADPYSTPVQYEYLAKQIQPRTDISTSWYRETVFGSSRMKCLRHNVFEMDKCCRYRFMAASPLTWDYDAATIPSALTDDMEQHQEARAAEKKAKQRVRELKFCFPTCNWISLSAVKRSHKNCDTYLYFFESGSKIWLQRI